MDYLKVYTKIIDRAKNRQLVGYTEKHHITPKCLGGSDNKFNLVILTAKEHFICHRLLCEIYPNEPKLKQALWLMAIGKQQSYKHKLSSRLYQKLKEQFVSTLKGNTNMLGKTHSKATKEKISKSHQGKTASKATKEKMSVSATGKSKTLEHKLKISKNHPTKKPVLQYDLQNNLLNEFESINEAARQTVGRVGDISACCNHKQKTAYGFIWKFKQ